MTQPWNAEVTTDAKLARSLIEEQFPHLAPVELEAMGEGWDNVVFRINQKWVFRFPRRQIAVKCLEAEERVLPRIWSRVPVPVPRIAFVGTPSRRYPWPFAGYSLIPGHTASAAGLSHQQRILTAKPLGSFLHKLHDIPTVEAASFGVEPDTLGRLDLKQRVPRLKAYLDDAQRLGLVSDITPLLHLIDQTAVERTHPRLALVHGDFYAKNIIVDDSGQLSGIIDWGDVHLGDPALDLSIAYGFLPEEGRELFCQSYGPIGPVTASLAKFRALYMALLILVYGHDSGDAALVREGRTALMMLTSYTH